MKAEICIDTQELVETITQKVIEAIKPLLKNTASYDGDILFDVEGLAKYLGVNRTWVYERTHLNDIPHFKIGRFPRFRKREIDKWLEGKRKPCRERPFDYISKFPLKTY